MELVRHFRQESRTPSLRRFTKLLCSASISASPAYAQAAMARRAPDTSEPVLIIRADDGGMSHSVDMALERLIATGLPVSVSVMFACPWYQETVELLKRHPNVAVGAHLTLNSEWKNYRWGPVAGSGAVPTLVDSNGYFFHSAEELHAHGASVQDVETELRAQIQRAIRSGLRIDYVDYHMRTVSSDPRFRGVAERLAHEYRLGMMGYFGDSIENPQYRAHPAQKTDSVVAYVSRLRSGIHVLVAHVGIDDAELGALVDMNGSGGLADMSRNRQGDLDALTSKRFHDAVAARDLRLITYRQLIDTHGLTAMRPPGQ